MELLDLAQPRTLADLVGLEQLVADVRKWDSDTAPQALLFHGPPGTGKTSAAYVIASVLLDYPAQKSEQGIYGEGDYFNRSQRLPRWLEHDINFIESNASDDRGIQFVREGLKDAMRVKPLGVKRKVILLDEADGLTPAAQDAMRQLIEKYSGNAMLILTCNELEKIRPAIRSRCSAYAFKPISPQAGADRLRAILYVEEHNDEALIPLLETLVELMNGDLRACLMFLDSIDLEDLNDRVTALAAMAEDDSALMAIDDDWVRLRSNLHGMLRNGYALNQITSGFYRNLYDHFDGEDNIDAIWSIMAAYGDVMTQKYTWPGDDYSYLDYMVAKMKEKVKKNE
jgi:DNA polymerase III delta prime subunit